MSVKPIKERLKDYYYRSMFRYFSVYIRPNDSVVEINPLSGRTTDFLDNVRFLFINKAAPDFIDRNRICSTQETQASPPDYFLLNGNIQFERDIHKFLSEMYPICSARTRIVITYYSSLWKPLVRLATALKLRIKTLEQNWISHEDMSNFLLLANFEPVLINSRIICPFYIPLISGFLNRYCAQLPFFHSLCMVHILIARPIMKRQDKSLSVSVVVPARNEAGNIENIVKRMVRMSPDDELIFVEGGSTDDTWDKIVEVKRKYSSRIPIKIMKQTGKGKGDAVRAGFTAASKDILMILDADMSVPPESLPLFYNAIVQDKGEFLNGSRLVYPMDKKAMRFFNMAANKFFAVAFSYMLGQRFKDTLCGTKVILKDNYRKIAETRSFFGNFDPFGDFDLIFGAARLGLKIVEIPIAYKERLYGSTNIRRWKHGLILFKMLLYSAKKIKFV